ncbi:hypothetical protein KTH_44740 [Thermosporothrix hazakensis]|nr:hypothetical protein KTH_44740 [Thermosporothrix hazakensis]
MQEQLTSQVKTLRENLEKAQQAGISTSAESLNTIKSLQSALHTITRELQKCPPDQVQAEVVAASSEHDPSSLVRQAKGVISAQRVRNWFPDSEQRDRDDEFESIVDVLE